MEYQSKYNRFPTVTVPGAKKENVWVGYQGIMEQLKKYTGKTIVIDCYPGVRDQEVLTAIKELLHPDTVIESIDAFYEEDELTDRMKSHLTDDRVFGVMYYGKVSDFMNPEKTKDLRKKAEESTGTTVVYGFGASLLCKGDVLVYADLARWEIQLRYRSHELGNYKCSNYEEDILRKYKRAFFIEWRIADKHKRTLYNDIDYLLDTNEKDHPKMITGDDFRLGLKQAVSQPFRIVPYFDPGVWGGQWMKKYCNLDPSAKNYAWSFDGVPEENSLLLDVAGTIVEIPSVNVIFTHPRELLGEKVFARFGAEFPIRFDFLDTIEGQALSLQVHPNRDYIQQLCGMTYTQDESYYILEAKEGASVYLGIKEGVNPEEMIDALADGQKGIPFDAEKFVNRWPAKKHDHFLIPAGTVHCSAPGCMVLEISATPYIFTFKLWDWGRVGLDGIPRPIHLEHGKHNIRFDRTTGWVKENLVSPVTVLHDGDDYVCEKTGLHEYEFIETRRYSFADSVEITTPGSVLMANLVDGDEILIESADDSFEPFEVHYAETFIIPEQLKKVRFVSKNGSDVKVLVANVRV
ncbi:MAG: class I mannose-6-phosphate isomerase [Erysipelotrichaceae bacterium]|nr:class I mannose-6-phosphate isomerase [Erysipelotrichaceae bacterium]